MVEELSEGGEKRKTNKQRDYKSKVDTREQNQFILFLYNQYRL